MSSAPPHRLAYLAHTIADYRACWLVHLSRHLRDRVEVFLVVATLPDRLREELAGSDVQVVEVGPGPRIVQRNGDGESTLEIEFNIAALRALRHHRISMTLSEGFGRWSVYALISKVAFGTKLAISWERTAWTDRDNGNLRRMYYRTISRLVDLFIVNGTEAKAQLKTFASSDAIRAERNYTCHDLFYVDPPSERQKGEKLNLLSCAGLIKRKGFHQFLSALATYPKRHQIALQIIGEGPYESYLKDLVARNSMHETVTFLGRRDRAEICAQLDSCDVFVLPTLEDNWSLVVLEALARHNVVASTPYNGASRDLIVPDETGFVFDPLQERSVHDFLDKAIDRAPEFPRMRKAAAAISQSYHPREVTREVAEAILEVAVE